MVFHWLSSQDCVINSEMIKDYQNAFRMFVPSMTHYHFVSLILAIVYFINLCGKHNTRFQPNIKDCTKIPSFLPTFESKSSRSYSCHLCLISSSAYVIFQVISARGLQCRMGENSSIHKHTNWGQCMPYTDHSSPSHVCSVNLKNGRNLQRGDYIPGVRPVRGQKSFLRPFATSFSKRRPVFVFITIIPITAFEIYLDW